ncbi:MAG: hypothetical protein ABI878_07135, partial [Acidobacteriota bacterium]
MFRSLSLTLFVSLFALSFVNVFAQNDKKVLGEVTIYAEDPIYKNLRTLSSAADAFGGDYAKVNNLVLHKDAAVFTLKTGEIYFIRSVEGKPTGAVFIGTGEFFLAPPVEIEKKSLAIFTDSPEVKEGFDTLTVFFTDDTFKEISASPAVTMGKAGPQADKARAAYRDKEERLRRDFHYNITSRILADMYAPDRKGFFTAFIDGKNFGKLVFQI